VKMISRTEVGGTFNAGLLWAAKKLGYTKKIWVHKAGDNSRGDHAELAGQEVAIDDPFIIDGKSVMYPGDVDSPASLNMNCSCTLLFA
jgi:hypothetical protein